jgi:cytochrome P450
MTAFLLGGHHSTATGIAGSLRHILAVPGLAPQIAVDDSTLARAIEESLRLTTPLQLFARTVRCDTSIGGVQFTEGDRLMLNLAAANRDEQQFTDPERFDINQRRKPHLAFGGGLHYCLGQHLARAEIRIAVRTLMERLPDLQLVGAAVEAGLTGGTLMPITSLPVAFTPSAGA